MKYALTLILLICTIRFTTAQVTVMNSGTMNLDIAICYYNFFNGWTTKGWISVKAGETKTIYNKHPKKHAFYYCARIAGYDNGFFGNVPRFVNVMNAFTFTKRDVNLDLSSFFDSKIKKFNFIKVDIKDKKSYNIELKPVSYNLVSNNKKQGKWIYPLDKEGVFSQKKEDNYYRREITFKDDEPIGWCRDYYEDGKLKAEFKLASFSPMLYDGKATWYLKDSAIEKEIIYKNGIAVSKTSKDSSGRLVTKLAKYKIIKMPLQTFYLNSSTNIGGNTKTAFYVNLPENTVEWYYEFSATRNQDEIASISNKFSAAAQLSRLLDKSGLTAGIINLLVPPPGGDICNVYLLDDKNYNSFMGGKEYRYYPFASRTNYKSGIVQVSDPKINKPVIGIKNNANTKGIHVAIQPIAVLAQF